MLGSDVRITLDAQGIEHTAVGRGDLDLTDDDAVAKAVVGHDVVVNCAAWTAVDLAEGHEDEAFEVNGVVAGGAGRGGARGGGGAGRRRPPPPPSAPARPPPPPAAPRAP